MTTSGKTLAQRIAAIEALDLEPIKFKTTRPGDDDGYGWSAEQAQRAATSYKRYLILRAKHPEVTLVPDKDTDRFWHMHILDTRKYAADCDNIFGKFMHHYPYFGLRGEDDARDLSDAFAMTHQLLAQEFGQQEQARAAFCADVPPSGKAAFCADVPPSGKAAFCADVPPSGKAAFCADVPPSGKAAFCADVPPSGKAAFCADVPPSEKAAFCADVPPSGKAAFCADVPPSEKAAFCADVPPSGRPAFCADVPPSDKTAFAWCADELPPARRAA